MRRPSPTAVGIFVLGALALIVAAVLFFGGGRLLARRLPAVSFFEGSVAGLNVGAPVTYRGVEVGQVKSIGIRIEPETFRTIVQVDMELVPQSVTFYGGGDLRIDESLVPTLVRRGLTAQLVRQNFVTGLLSVDLDFRPEAERTVETDLPHEIPTTPTDFERLARKARDIDLPATVDALQKTLAALERLLSAPATSETVQKLPQVVEQLGSTLATVESEITQLSSGARGAIAAGAGSLQQTLQSVQQLVAMLEKETAQTAAAARATIERADKTLAGAESALAALPATLEATNRTLEGANRLLDPHGRTMLQIERAVEDLAATAARLRNLAERLDRDPSVLLRGR